MNHNTKLDVSASKARITKGNDKTRTITAAGGTLHEGLFLAISPGGVGLYADRVIQPLDVTRDVVTDYGGVRTMHTKCVSITNSHRRAVLTGGSLDGAQFSRLIDRHKTLDDPTGELFILQQLSLPIQQRTRLLPMNWVDRRLREHIMSTGVGYMANTHTDRKRHNVRVKDLRLNKIASSVYLQPTNTIHRYDEIISPYKNNESKRYS
jgi:hypothetical protein